MKRLIGEANNGYIRNSKSGCFLPGTLVKKADNTNVAIETLVVGDELKAYDIQGLPDSSLSNDWVTWFDSNITGSNTTATVQVTNTYPGITEYYLINGTLKVTNDHHLLTFSFATGVWSFLQPSDIVVGNMFKTSTGGGHSISTITLETTPAIDTYTLDVETTDTYYVQCGSKYIVTHNIDTDIFKD